jgi:hypothetical protein
VLLHRALDVDRRASEVRQLAVHDTRRDSARQGEEHVL